jgi:hypothetical protein
MRCTICNITSRRQYQLLAVQRGRRPLPVSSWTPPPCSRLQPPLQSVTMIVRLTAVMINQTSKSTTSKATMQALRLLLLPVLVTVEMWSRLCITDRGSGSPVVCPLPHNLTYTRPASQPQLSIQLGPPVSAFSVLAVGVRGDSAHRLLRNTVSPQLTLQIFGSCIISAQSRFSLQSVYVQFADMLDPVLRHCPPSSFAPCYQTLLLSYFVSSTAHRLAVRRERVFRNRTLAMALRKPPILRASLAVLHQGGTRCDLICLTECELHRHRQLALVEKQQHSDVPTQISYQYDIISSTFTRRICVRQRGAPYSDGCRSSRTLCSSGTVKQA